MERTTQTGLERGFVEGARLLRHRGLLPARRGGRRPGLPIRLEVAPGPTTQPVVLESGDRQPVAPTAGGDGHPVAIERRQLVRLVLVIGRMPEPREERLPRGEALFA